MEDLLLNVVKEASGSKLASLKQSAQEAHGKGVKSRRITATLMSVCLRFVVVAEQSAKKPFPWVEIGMFYSP